MSAVQSYPAEVAKVNGSDTGPFNPGPASSFVYDLDVTMDGGVRRIVGIAPHPYRRWPDAFDSIPFPIGCPVSVFRIGNIFIMDTAEMPYTRECQPQ